MIFATGSISIINYTIYNEKYSSDDHFSYNSPCHYMRAWIRVLDAPGCYERAGWAERKSALQGSGLVRTVGPCAQRRVALLMLRVIETHWRVLRGLLAKQALAHDCSRCCIPPRSKWRSLMEEPENRQ